MALVSCPDCKREISTEALSCPNCGRPIAKIYCKHCGKENKNYSVSCDRCGRRFEAASREAAPKSEEDKAKSKLTTKQILWGAAAAFIVLVTYFSIVLEKPNSGVKKESNQPDPAIPSYSTPSTEVPARESTANDVSWLDKMEVIFEGGYSKEQIKPLLDRALQLYGEPITEENYSRAASTLVALRKKYGPKEMEMLDYMVRSYVPGTSLHFAEAASLACAFLAAGDK